MAAEQGGGRLVVAPGLVLFFRVLACGMVSAVFVLTTDPGRFVRALMADLRLPPSFGFALMQALHLVPDLGREAQVLRMARAIRLGRPMRRIPAPSEVAALTVPLLAFAIRRAGRAAVAMEARGLAPGRPRTHLPQPPMGRADTVFIVLGLGVLAALVAAV
jgi:energy-coupling factor transport system permease protein